MTEEDFQIERCALARYVTARQHELREDGYSPFEAWRKAQDEWFVGHGYAEEKTNETD